MNIYDKWFATEWIFSIIGLIIGIILWLVREDKKFEKITNILLIQFLVLVGFTIGYLIFVELLLDKIWGLNIHLPFSFVGA